MGRMVLFYCDLPVTGPSHAVGHLERKKNLDELSTGDLDRITSHWNPETMRGLIEQRFSAQAELWLLRWNGMVAAYGWTLKEKTIEPHFIPIQPGDVHLFDFFVFPEFRGRGLNPSFVSQLLVEAGREGMKRALIEAAAWNAPQLSSLAKTPFRRFGVARKFYFGKSATVLHGALEK